YYSSVLHQLGDTLGQLSAHTLPVFDTIVIDTKALFLTTGYWIKESNALDKTAVTCLAAVSDSQVVKWTLLGTATR
ncbi:UNVERIFIED_CONTAM: hypothetical protein GTU68_034955, partial [Idotea baltica]|nr:hypothetical protein [Idotea baltica]